MPLLPLDLGQGSNPGRHVHAGVARLVNCYAEAAEDGKSQWPLWASDGLAAFATLTGAAGGVRAMLAVDSDLYAVAGRVLYRIDMSGLVTVLGGIASDGPCSMARNRQRPYPQIAIVSDGLYYLLQNNVLTQIRIPALPPPAGVCWVDGYFVFAISDGRYFISDIDEGNTVAALDYAVAEANPDGLVTAKVRAQDLILFGVKSIEIHKNTGAADFPFTRSTAINVGCYGAKSVVEASILAGGQIADTLAWIASDAQGRYAGVCILDAYTARTISTPDIDRLIQTDTAPSEITGTAWVSEGHSFYAISGANWTRVYDFKTGKWHDRESGDGNRWRCRSVVAFGRDLIAGDATTGRLYKMSRSYLNEAGDDMIVTVQLPPAGAFPNRMEFNDLWLDVVPGVGLESAPDVIVHPGTFDLVGFQWRGQGTTVPAALLFGQALLWGGAALNFGGLGALQNVTWGGVLMGWGSTALDPPVTASGPSADPKIMMQHSPDGKNWSAEQWRGLGQEGQNQTRLRWTRLGTSGSHGRTFRFRCSASVVRGLLQARFDGKKVAA